MPFVRTNRTNRRLGTPVDDRIWREIYVKCRQEEYQRIIQALREKNFRAVPKARVYDLLEKKTE